MASTIKLDPRSDERADRNILDSHVRSRSKAVAAPTLVRPREEQSSAPLSFAQERLWFLDQINTGDVSANISRAVRITGKLRSDVLQQSLQELIDRHQSLRTTFAAKQLSAGIDSKARQWIATSSTIKVELIDLSSAPLEERGAKARLVARDHAQHSFDLTLGPLMRVTLVKLEECDHVLLFTIHGIVSDERSVDILFRELWQAYAARDRGEHVQLPRLPVQYADYAVWQRDYLNEKTLQEESDYWKAQLRGMPAVLELPTDRPRPAIQNWSGSSLSFVLDEELTRALIALSEDENATLFMTVMTAFQVLLSRYSTQLDIIVGTTVANRELDETKDIVGPLANAVAIRTDLSDNPTFQELLARVKTLTLESEAHRAMPFEKLVDELQLERSLSYAPVFQIALNFHESPTVTSHVGALILERFEFDPGIAPLDLSLDIQKTKGQLEGRFRYDSDLFDRETIERIGGHFEVLLRSIVKNPEWRVLELPLLTEAERQQILVQWNKPRISPQPGGCIHDAFETAVEKTPQAIAVVCGDDRLSYRKLNQRANQLAHYLRSLGIGLELRVGVFLERSAENIVALLAILKAGAAYVPIDPSYPKDRLSFMLQDASVPVLITEASLVPNLPKHRAEVILIDEDWSRIEREDTENLRVQVAPQNLAYVIYTSGSTGRPKGVSVTHQAVTHLFEATREQLGFREGDVWTTVHSSAFDFSVWEIWGSLLQGGQLVIVPLAVAQSPPAFCELLRKEGVTVLNQTPAALRQLLDYEPNIGHFGLRTIVCGGDALDSELAEQLTKLGLPVWNFYGPTESTVWATLTRIEPGVSREQLLSIGRPIADIEIYLLDEYLQPVPIGVPGELCIGGRGLARSYLHRPELSAEKFIPNPFSHEPGERIYRTGDLARYFPDGKIEFLGRLDNQVKLRGFRIELGEIEALLSQHPQVRQAVVAARESKHIGKRLVAYVVPELGDGSSTGNTAQNLQIEQVSEWEDPRFNVTGWNSIFTGKPIPAAEMKEWLDETVKRILSLAPRRVLEIGCGSGLLVFRIAPHCLEYHATDFSRTTLDTLRQQISGAGDEYRNVQLSQQPADHFLDIDTEAFDTVILNSVVQYFPSIDYLIRVLDKSIKSLRPGGSVFLGDLRSLSLLRSLHTNVQLQHAPASLALSDLRMKVDQQMAQEKELVIDPGLFSALQDQIPEISHVDIQLKRGRYHNELTKFRYDVVLHKGVAAVPPVETNWLHWQKDKLDVGTVRRLLRETKPEILAIRSVPDGRLMAEVRILELLRAENGSQTVGELRGRLEEHRDHVGVDPEDVWAVVDDLPYSATVGWFGTPIPGTFDVVLRREGQTQNPLSPTTTKVDSLQEFANNPLRDRLMHKLLPNLRELLADKLPDYMIPAEFVMLHELPLTPNRKVDRRALPEPDKLRRDCEATYLAPRDNLERQLVNIWETVLGVKSPGVNDNFFELGGHSLLAVRLFAHIENRFGKRLPLSALFQAPTVEQLANVLRDTAAAKTWSSLVAIQTQGSKPPLFCVHAAGANVLIYRPLSRHLGSDQPVYALQAQGLDGQRQPLAKLEEMAALYVKEILAIQPQGPYYLLGASFGGLVIFEMAHQLFAQGQDVALMAMLNTNCPVYTLVGRARCHVGHLMRYGPRFYLREIGKGLKRRLGMSVAPEVITSAPDPDLTRLMQNRRDGDEALVRTVVAILDSEKEYSPRGKVYGGAITLFWARDAARDFEDNRLGWRRLATGGLEVHVVPGDHATIREEPNVGLLVDKLKDCLERARSQDAALKS